MTIWNQRPLYELQSSAGHGRSTEDYVFELGYAIRNADDTIDRSRWQVDAIVGVYVGTPYCTPELRRVLDGATISAPKAGYDSQSQSYVSATFTLSAFQNAYSEGYWGTDVAYSTSLNFFTGDYDTSVPRYSNSIRWRQSDRSQGHARSLPRMGGRRGFAHFLSTSGTARRREVHRMASIGTATVPSPTEEAGHGRQIQVTLH